MQTEAKDSPRPDFVHHRRRLSSTLRTSSVDNTPRGSLLCPPRQENTSDIVHQSVSLDDLQKSPGVRLTVPALQKITDAASPSSSEPTLPLVDRHRGVNFCPSADHEGTPATYNGEREPMLNGDGELESVGQGQNSPNLSRTDSTRSATIRTWFSGISRLMPKKISVNGLKRESLV